MGGAEREGGNGGREVRKMGEGKRGKEGERERRFRGVLSTSSREWGA